MWTGPVVSGRHGLSRIGPSRASGPSVVQGDQLAAQVCPVPIRLLRVVSGVTLCDMVRHQVMSFTNGLSAKLATRSRHVCVLLGAGASCACGLPDVSGLQVRVLDGLVGGQRTALEHQLSGRNLEQALSRVRRITALLDETTDRVDGLTAKEATDLDRAVCRLIVGALDLADADMAPMLRFAAWVARAEYHWPVELFTVNYDLLLETALESLGVPYFDGFAGALRARFRTELVEASAEDTDDWLPSFLVRLWKLHGSVHWAWKDSRRTEVVRLGVPVADSEPAAIYWRRPSQRDAVRRGSPPPALRAGRLLLW